MKNLSDILHGYKPVRVQLGEVRFANRQRLLDLPSMTPSLLLLLAACYIQISVHHPLIM